MANMIVRKLELGMINAKGVRAREQRITSKIVPSVGNLILGPEGQSLNGDCYY